MRISIRVGLIKDTNTTIALVLLSVMQGTLLISAQNMLLRVDFLTASQWFIGSLLSKYQIIYFIQNGAYQDCDFNKNNGINTCGSKNSAIFLVFSITLSECFIKSHSLNRCLSQKVLCTFWGVPGGDPVMKNSLPQPDSKGGLNDWSVAFGTWKSNYVRFCRYFWKVEDVQE